MFTRRLAAAIGLLFALIGTQGPEFSQQYRQRLAARSTRSSASSPPSTPTRRSNQSPRSRPSPARGQSRPLAQARGAAIETDIARRNKLQNAFDAMRDAGPVQRIGAMAVDFDPAIGADTLQNFEPAVPVTSEALLVGALALIVGWAARTFAPGRSGGAGGAARDAPRGDVRPQT